MITLEQDKLVFRFPDVHPEASFSVDFQRTLRIPDDGKEYPLPAGIGRLPIRHIDDYAENLIPDLLRRGGVILPMHASEATWLNFGVRPDERQYPFALKIAAGKINAITGQPWSAALDGTEQDYIVVPGQRWLDGFCVEKGVIRQFIAERLGDGYSVEEQLTGKAEFGGLQLIAYPMKAARYEVLRAEQEQERRREHFEERRHQWGTDLTKLLHSAEIGLGELRDMEKASFDRRLPPIEEMEARFAARLDAIQRDIDHLRQRRTHSNLFSACFSMRVSETHGLSAGGRMAQKVHVDPYGVDAWDQSASSRCFIGILDAGDWLAVTGTAPPSPPLSAAKYQAMGIPWFDKYEPTTPALPGGKPFEKVIGWAKSAMANGKAPHGNESLHDLKPVPIGKGNAAQHSVREMDI